jgi:hypothetical protein
VPTKKRARGRPLKAGGKAIHPYALRLPSDLYASLRQMAKHRTDDREFHVSVNDLIVEAVRTWLRTAGPPQT